MRAYVVGQRTLRMSYEPKGCSAAPAALPALDDGVAVQGLLALDRVIHDRLAVPLGNPVRRSPRLMKMVDRQLRQFRDIAPDVGAVGVKFLCLAGGVE